VTRSILSTGEQAVAEGLREGLDAEQIAQQRGEPVQAVEKSIDRIREKTDRALATLAESPFVEERVAGMDDPDRERIRERLSDSPES
jgi:DNA-binding NarL/FixJ family response regulator